MIMKSMLKYIISIAILGLVAFPSCTDLEETLYADITTQNYEYTQDNVVNLIGPLYENMRVMYGNPWNHWGVQEITSDEIVQPANASGWYDGGTFLRMSQHRWSSDQGHVNGQWSR